MKQQLSLCFHCPTPLAYTFLPLFFHIGFTQKHFAFPPQNTPTEEYANSKSFHQHVVPPTIITTSNENPPLHRNNTNSQQLQYLTEQRDEVSSSLLSPGYTHHHRDSFGLCPDSFLHSKPRSYSTNRDFHSPLTTERVSKQRSYSFDAVGRAHKYVAGLCHKKDPELLIGQCGQHSPPSFHRDSIGSDEGIGSSGGSAESMESLPNKRKVYEALFGMT